MTRVTLLRIAACLVILSFAIVGCDGDGDGDSPAAQTTTPGTQDSGTPAGDGETGEAIDVTGTWDGFYNYASSSNPLDYRFVLTQTGSSITGTGIMPSDPHSLLEVQGTIDGNHVVLKFPVWGDTIWWDMTVSGNTMAGTYNDSSRSYSGACSFTR